MLYNKRLMHTILVEGASTAHGWFDEELNGWTNRLELEMLEHNQTNPAEAIIVDNRALPGIALNGILKNFEADVMWALRVSDRVLPVLSAGLNEAKTSPTGSRSCVSLDRFSAQLGQFFIHARSTGSPAILVGPQWVDEDRTQPVANFGFSVTNSSLEAYSEVMRSIADDEGAVFVDTFAYFRDNGGSELLSRDGCHPNALGHAAMHRQVSEAIRSTGFIA